MLLHHYYTSESQCDKNFEIEVKFMENKKSINNIEYIYWLVITTSRI